MSHLPFFAFLPFLILLEPTDFSFFFNDTATPEIYTLSLHDALPILSSRTSTAWDEATACGGYSCEARAIGRSEEHTSELQSLAYLVCRLLLEKKKQIQYGPRNEKNKK